MAIEILGLPTGPVGPLYQTIIQERVGPDVRGRVFSLSGVTMAAIPHGAICFGLLMQERSVPAALGVQTMVILAGGVALW